MPTYEYACKSCGERLEVVQRFSDDPLTECPACQGELRKVYGSIGVSFKGSGFYKTDSRSSSSAAKAASPGSEGSGQSSDSSGEGSSSSDTKATEPKTSDTSASPATPAKAASA